MENEAKIINYKYDIEVKEATLLIGEDLDSAKDVDGWNINLVTYEIWSDGDRVRCNVITITSATEGRQAEYLKDVVKTSVIFSFVFQLGITQAQAYTMFL